MSERWGKRDRGDKERGPRIHTHTTTHIELPGALEGFTNRLVSIQIALPRKLLFLRAQAQLQKVRGHADASTGLRQGLALPHPANARPPSLEHKDSLLAFTRERVHTQSEQRGQVKLCA